jgi:CBS domain containing-hemolysin-like protein
MSTLAVWAVLMMLLLLRGLLGAMEASLHGVSDARIKELAQSGSWKARRVSQLKVAPEVSAAALRSGMVFAGFTAAAMGVLVPPRMLNESLAKVLETSWAWVTPLTSAALVALVASVVDVAFRSAASQRPEATALFLSRLGAMTVWVLGPFVRGVVVPLNLLVRPFGGRVSLQPPAPPLEELEKQLIRQAQTHQVDKGAPQLIRSIFELSDKTCRDVMVPRTEVVAIDVSTPLPVILQLIAEENHSRIPVFKDDIDHIIGILHVRDIVPMVQNPELILLRDLLRPVAYVPWVKPIGDLLRDMQRQRIHMAVVVDEYGGFSGIVTLEDILREIVGDIGDEFAKDEKSVELQGDDSFLVDAMLPVADFAQAFEFKFPEGDFETLGGFLGHLAGAIPEVSDRFTHAGWTFIVHAKAGPRLERVKVLKPRPPPPGSGSGGETKPSHERLEAVKA